MSWETEKNKLNKSNETSFSTDRDRGRQKKSDQSIDSRMTGLNRTEGVVSKLYDLSQDWIQMVSTNGNFDSETGEWLPDAYNWNEQALGYDLSLGIFDTRLLPYLKAHFMFQPVEEIDSNKILEWVDTGLFYTVENLIGQSNDFFKNVTLHLTCKIRDFRPLGDQGDYQLQRPWKVKIVVTLANPRQFV